ncbi:hypothetical protein Ate01nite_64380 [Actinoplanes teichomyceticus]|nr:hypothetical protein Ate01nite_64380 [Actinoplanes teichomyceticus]
MTSCPAFRKAHASGTIGKAWPTAGNGMNKNLMPRSYCPYAEPGDSCIAAFSEWPAQTGGQHIGALLPRLQGDAP